MYNIMRILYIGCLVFFVFSLLFCAQPFAPVIWYRRPASHYGENCTCPAPRGRLGGGRMTGATQEEEAARRRYGNTLPKYIHIFNCFFFVFFARHTHLVLLSKTCTYTYTIFSIQVAVTKSVYTAVSYAFDSHIYYIHPGLGKKKKWFKNTRYLFWGWPSSLCNALGWTDLFLLLLLLILTFLAYHQRL